MFTMAAAMTCGGPPGQFMRSNDSRFVCPTAVSTASLPTSFCARVHGIRR